MKKNILLNEEEDTTQTTGTTAGEADPLTKEQGSESAEEDADAKKEDGASEQAAA